MGRVVLRAEIAQRCRELSGQETLGQSADRLFISEDELNRMIDAAMRDLYDMLVQARGHEYYAATASSAPGSSILLAGPTTVRGQYGYDLPADWYQTLAVRVRFGSDDVWHDAPPYAPGDAASLRNSNAVGGSRALRYRHGGSYATDADPVHRDRLVLSPTPADAVTLEVDYIPTYLTTTESVSYNGVQGWEDYAVYSVVADILAKEESDPSYWMARKGEVAARIRALAGSRDAGHPQYISCRDPIDSRGPGRGVGRRAGWLP